MPAYDYRCNSCKRRVVLRYKTYADYDNAIPICPHCQSKELTRLISRIAIAKSEGSRFESVDSMDESALDDMANADPATLGRYMRRMSDGLGEDLGDEFNEVVDRLQRGEDADSIEASMGDLDMPGVGGDMSAGDE